VLRELEEEDRGLEIACERSQLIYLSGRRAHGWQRRKEASDSLQRVVERISMKLRSSSTMHRANLSPLLGEIPSIDPARSAMRARSLDAAVARREMRGPH
jgi:hypothetical protein